MAARYKKEITKLIESHMQGALTKIELYVAVRTLTNNLINEELDRIEAVLKTVGRKSVPLDIQNDDEDL